MKKGGGDTVSRYMQGYEVSIRATRIAPQEIVEVLSDIANIYSCGGEIGRSVSSGSKYVQLKDDPAQHPHRG